MIKNITWYITGFFVALLVILEFMLLPGEYIFLKVIVIALTSIFIILKASDYVVASISNYAKLTGISNFIIGFIIIGIGTSLPDLSTAIFASLDGNGELALGDVLGANIVVMTLVFGISLIMSRNFVIKEHIASKALITMLALKILPLVLGIDGKFTFSDGIILIAGFVFYLFELIKKDAETSHIKKNVTWENIWKDMFVFLGALIALLLGTRWLVYSSVEIAKSLNIPLFFIGLVLIGIVTSFPELMVVIKSTLQKKTEFTFGDSFGSSAITASVVLGVACLINDIKVDMDIFIISAVFMILTTIIASFLIQKRELTKNHGLFLIALYAIYLIIISVRAL